MHNAPGAAQSTQNPDPAARLVLLVTASVFINYIDRGNLAAAAPLMQDELHLSASQLGVLLSAFYYGCVICMPGMVLLPAAGSVAALFVFEIVSGCSYPGIFAIPQIKAGPGAAGRWVGVQNATGNLAGLIGWVFLLPKIVPLTWTTSPAANRVAPAPSVG